jgi:3'-phosphoadenosine 5'-phosphosulfate sulfotransferase (PAPS reductase)/FAD synthetase
MISGDEKEYESPKPGDYLIVGSVSGGKDSTAMALWLKEQGHDCRWVFADTGWEDRQTYDYLREVLPKAIGPIDWVRHERTFTDEREQIALNLERRLGRYSSMVRLLLYQRMFPGKFHRFCTTHLKVKPIAEYIRALNDEVINAVGIRADESARRAEMPAMEYSEAFKCDTWRPILDWSVQDVIDIHHRHGIKPNPLYLQGASRVGCWPCIYARKAEIRHWSKDEERVAIIRDLERIMTESAAERAAAKGKELKKPLTWFCSRNKGSIVWPIDQAIEWANTAYGGRQFEMFAGWGEEAGCVRWGLCDAGDLGGEE